MLPNIAMATTILLTSEEVGSRRTTREEARGDDDGYNNNNDGDDDIDEIVVTEDEPVTNRRTRKSYTAPLANLERIGSDRSRNAGSLSIEDASRWAWTGTLAKALGRAQ